MIENVYIVGERVMEDVADRFRRVAELKTLYFGGKVSNT